MALLQPGTWFGINFFFDMSNNVILKFIEKLTPLFTITSNRGNTLYFSILPLCWIFVSAKCSIKWPKSRNLQFLFFVLFFFCLSDKRETRIHGWLMGEKRRIFRFPCNSDSDTLNLIFPWNLVIEQTTNGSNFWVWASISDIFGILIKIIHRSLWTKGWNFSRKKSLEKKKGLRFNIKWM